MKNILFSVLTTALVMFSIQTAEGQTTDNTKASVTTVAQPDNRPAFVDGNNDGICDNYATRPADGRGRRFVDANNDGKCDNVRQNNGKGRGKGTCRANGQRRGQGFGQGRGGRNNVQPAIIQEPADQKK